MERVESAAAWGRVLERLAADHDALVDDFVGRLRSSGIYDERLVSTDDLMATASDTMDLLIASLAGAPLTERLRTLPARLGAKRARQGVDRDSLLQAVRLDFRVLWVGLQRALGPTPADVLVLHAEDVLEVVERYIADVQDAFSNEEAMLARGSRVERERALGRLLHANGDADATARLEADRLRWPLDGEFEVACVANELVDGALRALAARPGPKPITWDSGTSTIIVRERGGTTMQVALAGIACGIAPRVTGLAAVPAAGIHVAAIAPYADEEPVTEDEAWVALAHDLLVPVLPRIAAVRAALDALPEAERERIEDTVRVVCVSGSVQDAASSLFVHRNTIVNRLATFRQHTGLDLQVPADAAVAILGLGLESNGSR